MQFQFDASQWDPTFGYEQWPLAQYTVRIIDHKELPNPQKGGRVGLTIVSDQLGPNKPQMISLGLNALDQGQRERAHKELSAITRVTLGANQGRMNFNDFSELHNIPFIVLAGPQKDNPQFMQFGQYRDIHGRDALGRMPPDQPNQQAPGLPPAMGGNAPPPGFGGGAPQTPYGAPSGFGGPPQAQPGFGPPPGQPGAPMAPQQPQQQFQAPPPPQQPQPQQFAPPQQPNNPSWAPQQQQPQQQQPQGAPQQSYGQPPAGVAPPPGYGPQGQVPVQQPPQNWGGPTQQPGVPGNWQRPQ